MSLIDVSVQRLVLLRQQVSQGDILVQRLALQYKQASHSGIMAFEPCICIVASLSNNFLRYYVWLGRSEAKFLIQEGYKRACYMYCLSITNSTIMSDIS
jgi:hypothetical protein